MPCSSLLVEKKGGRATVTLNRPNKLNTLSMQLLLDLKQVVSEFRYDLETRFIIFADAGRAFTGDFDLRP